MCISDWSSDVCSSERPAFIQRPSIRAFERFDHSQIITSCVIKIKPRSRTRLQKIAYLLALTGQGDGFAAQLCNETGSRWRSEEHTSELKSLMRISYDVFCLKKKNST